MREEGTKRYTLSARLSLFGSRYGVRVPTRYPHRIEAECPEEVGTGERRCISLLIPANASTTRLFDLRPSKECRSFSGFLHGIQLPYFVSLSKGMCDRC
jgi:hypothetical protein